MVIYNLHRFASLFGHSATLYISCRNLCCLAFLFGQNFRITIQYINFYSYLFIKFALFLLPACDSYSTTDTAGLGGRGGKYFAKLVSQKFKEELKHMGENVTP